MIGVIVVVMGVHRSGDAGFGRGGGIGLVQVEAIKVINKIQLVVYYQCCVLIG